MRRLALYLGLVPLLIGGSVPGRPGAEPPNVLDRLVGSWEGEGELFRRPAAFSMTWSRTLDGRFLRLEYENRLVQPDGSHRRVLAAIALYRVAEGKTLRGAWFDSRGEILELQAEASDSTLVTRWIGESEEGRTVYRLTGAGAMIVEDDVLDGEEWRPFGRATYRRVGE